MTSHDPDHSLPSNDRRDPATRVGASAYDTRPRRARAVPPALARAWSRREFLAWSVASGTAAWLPESADAAASDGTFAGRVEASRAVLAVPGLAVAAVGRDWCQCASSGTRAVPTDEPLAPHDAWPLAGHARVVTAALVVRLVERGAISWQTTLGETLGYQLIPRMHPDWERVTVADLLTHAAGLPPYDEPLALLSLAAATSGDSSVIRQRLRATAQVLSTPASRVPDGRAAASSQAAYLVAATLVESLLDRPLEDVLADAFALGPARGPGSHGEVHGHLRQVGRWRVQPRDRLPWGHAALAPAGGLELPVRAYGAVLQALLVESAQAARPAETLRVVLGPAAGWRLARVDGAPTLVQTCVDPRGYAIVAMARPAAMRAVVVWSNGIHAGVPGGLADVASAHLSS